jgi:negative regulator of genetic competence, sporulation and motility
MTENGRVFLERRRKMDFLVVSDSKLKIMLTREEMIKYGIDKEDIDYDDPKIRRSFWRILDEARQKCGFESSGDKVLIQFYPSKDGSEIFVTKLGLVSAGAERTISKSTKVAMLSTRRAVYRFSTLDDLVSASHAINTDECDRMPRAFYSEDGAYYIIADERSISAGSLKDVSAVSEYGTEIPSNLAPYIAEHSNEIEFSFLQKL